MGKKRTSTAKKKQLAKKNKLSSTFGVSVLRGGTIARNNGVLDSKLTSIDDSSSAKKPCGSSCDGVKNGATSTASAQRNAEGYGQHTPGTYRPLVRNCENDDFQHLHASLEERSLAQQARQDEQRQMKRIRRNGRQMKGFGKYARHSTTPLFAPATLTLAPKTTQELVDDATNRVAQGMNEIGRHATIEQMDGVSAIPSRSSHAAAASLNWKLRVSNVTSQLTAQEHHSNPYAALDNDSESENSWAEINPKVDSQRFQFKPASFLFQPTSPDVPVIASCSGDDIDPDL